jgi:methionine transaminase
MEFFGGKIPVKLPGTGPSIFSRMTALANQEGAINLSQGFPDFEVSPVLINLVHEYMQKGFNQYAPMQGLLELRQQIAVKTAMMYGAEYDPESEITITAGATQAISSIITAFVKPGDEVIIFDPSFDIYGPAVLLNGGIPRYYNLRFPNYDVNWDEVRAMVNDRTRIILINTPHNPSGTVWKPSDMRELEKTVEGSDIIVLSDEVYELITFDGLRHESLCRYPKLASRGFVVCSFGKNFHVTGWKTGYTMAPEPLMREFRHAHQNIVFAANRPLQHAFADYLRDPANYINIGQMYQQKRDLFLKLISESRFRPLPSSGTYFQLLDYSEISDESEMDFVVRLTREYKIAGIPVSVFYNDSSDHKVIRLCFAKRDETLHQSAEILCRI